MTTNPAPLPSGWAIVPANDPRLDCLPSIPLVMDTDRVVWRESVRKIGAKISDYERQHCQYAFPFPTQAMPAKSDSPLARQEGGSHYKDCAIQPVEFIHANGLGFLEGCVIKRICRHRRKNGAEDLRKAIHELELLIALEYSTDVMRDHLCPA